jgi:hypothetical protein
VNLCSSQLLINDLLLEVTDARCDHDVDSREAKCGRRVEICASSVGVGRAGNICGNNCA